MLLANFLSIGQLALVLVALAVVTIFIVVRMCSVPDYLLVRSDVENDSGKISQSAVSEDLIAKFKSLKRELDEMRALQVHQDNLSKSNVSPDTSSHVKTFERLPDDSELSRLWRVVEFKFESAKSRLLESVDRPGSLLPYDEASVPISFGNITELVKASFCNIRKTFGTGYSLKGLLNRKQTVLIVQFIENDYLLKGNKIFLLDEFLWYSVLGAEICPVPGQVYGPYMYQESPSHWTLTVLEPGVSLGAFGAESLSEVELYFARIDLIIAAIECLYKMHKLGVCHGDVSADKFFVNSSKKVCIVNFCYVRPASARFVRFDLEDIHDMFKTFNPTILYGYDTDERKFQVKEALIQANMAAEAGNHQGMISAFTSLKLSRG